MNRLLTNFRHSTLDCANTFYFFDHIYNYSEESSFSFWFPTVHLFLFVY